MSRVVVVTGAARGIGDAVARAFVELGDRVVALDVLDPEEPSKGEYIRADGIHSARRVRSRKRRGTLSRPERIDVLVNNAGIQRVGPTAEISSADWLQVIGTNLSGAFFCASAAESRMGTGASVSSISSAAAIVGLPGRRPYAAAKTGLLGLTRVMALELATRGIRVNAVCPGMTRTPVIQRVSITATCNSGRCSSASR